jgi:signal transduction histidine kinase
LKYSPDDTPIALGSAVRLGELRLWVRDQGIGIAPDERERVLAGSDAARPLPCAPTAPGSAWPSSTRS